MMEKTDGVWKIFCSFEHFNNSFHELLSRLEGDTNIEGPRQKVNRKSD